MLAINLLGSIRLARAAMRVMRPAGYGRIILVASTGGLHADVGDHGYGLGARVRDHPAGVVPFVGR